MYTLFAAIARFFTPPAAGFAPNAVARHLMEGASTRAGQNPRQARELRRAARAWLSVVR